MKCTQISSIPAPADIQQRYHGPQEKEKIAGQRIERNYYAHMFNETASLTDEVAYRANIAALTEAMKSKLSSLQDRIKAIKRIRIQLKCDSTHAGETHAKLTAEAVKRLLMTLKI